MTGCNNNTRENCVGTVLVIFAYQVDKLVLILISFVKHLCSADIAPETMLFLFGAVAKTAVIRLMGA